MKRILIYFIVLSCSLIGLNAEYYGFGMNNILFIDKLPIKRNFSILKQESSHDRTGGNADGLCNRLLYIDNNNEKVIFSCNGSGLISRIWQTGFQQSDILKFYFDDENIPSFILSIKDIYHSNNQIFPFPLVLNEVSNSGACVSYIDIPFNKSLKITTNGDAFFQFEYYLFPDKNIESWKKGNINPKITEKLQNTFTNPNNNISLRQSISNKLINPNDSIVLLDLKNQNIMNSLEMSFKNLEHISQLSTLKDNGRGHKSKSSFKINLNNKIDTLKLIKRFDVGNDNNQLAKIKINGEDFGIWSEYCLDKRYRWKNSELSLDIIKLNNPKELNIEIFYYPKFDWMVDWNEFYYWIYADNVLIDSLDIGDTISENNHSYTIENQSWYGTQELAYFSSDDISDKKNDILKNSRILFYFDNLKEPLIDAPLDLFFGVGSYGRFENKSLMIGYNKISNLLYNYFPIPFKQNAKIILVNKSKSPIEDLVLNYSFDTKIGDINNYQYFNAVYKTNQDSSKDYNVINTRSSGHIVGIINDYSSHEHIKYLECDDRIYIDNLKTPMIYGTGLEDFFNSGFYFHNGLISNPFNGLIDHKYSNRIMYRLFINDPIVFHNKIELNFEKNSTFQSNIYVRSLVFYYSDLKSNLILSDSIICGNSKSEIDHNYQNANSEREKVISSFEGTYDFLKEELIGNIIKNESSFSLNIDSTSQNIYLSRIFNYSFLNQKAEVYIDGNYSGIWFNPGNNDSIRLREDLFFIKPELTLGKSKINIEIKNIGNVWSECKYYSNSYLNKEYNFEDINDTNDQIDRKDFSVYPNPSNDFIRIEFKNDEERDYTVRIYNMLGEIVFINNVTNPINNIIRVDLNNLNNGTYIVETVSGTKRFKQLIIKN